MPWGGVGFSLSLGQDELRRERVRPVLRWRGAQLKEKGRKRKVTQVLIALWRVLMIYIYNLLNPQIILYNMAYRFHFKDKQTESQQGYLLKVTQLGLELLCIH